MLFSRRVAVRQDTCSIVAISLNIMQKVHPVIWSLSNLPFDCTQVMAVPKPIGEFWGSVSVLCWIWICIKRVLITLEMFAGGVVVFAVNSLLYLNQSVPPYGVSLNSQTNGTTAFPLRKINNFKPTPVRVSLDMGWCSPLYTMSLLCRCTRWSEAHAGLLSVWLYCLRQDGDLAERRGDVSYCNTTSSMHVNVDDIKLFLTGCCCFAVTCWHW